MCIRDSLCSGLPAHEPLYRRRTGHHGISLYHPKPVSYTHLTAAPAAAFFISDWIAYQIGMISQGLDAAGIDSITPMGAYIKSLPFNMYSIFTLLFVGMLMYTGRDYGPMLKAEVRALTTGQFTKTNAHPMLNVGHELGEPKRTKPMIRSFVLPIVVTFAKMCIRDRSRPWARWASPCPAPCGRPPRAVWLPHPPARPCAGPSLEIKKMGEDQMSSPKYVSIDGRRPLVSSCFL